MQKINVFPADTFIVMNKTVMTTQDRDLLFMLYQPIIGSQATSLYMTLCSYLDQMELLSKEWTHHHLMTNMRLSLDEIIQNREKLEAIGLIKTFMKKGNVNTYLYELYSPLSAQEFFCNPLLQTALRSNLGEQDYKKIQSFFKLPKLEMSGYEEIGCKFHDVFESLPIRDVTEVTDHYKKHTVQEISIDMGTDVERVLSFIPEEIVNPRSLTKETKELIYKVAFLYHFHDKDLEEVLLNSVDSKKSIDKEKLKLNSCNYYKFEHQGKLPNLIYKNQPEYLRKKIIGNSKKEKLIYTFETTSPYLFLSSKYQGGTPSRNDLDILAYLVDEVGLNPGVINVLIDYVLRINDNKLVRGFIESIASQWKLSKVETVEQAIQISKREQKRRETLKLEKHNGAKNKVVELQPTWFKETIASREATKEELAEMEAIINEFK